jgi:hypothetical protein
MNTFSELFCLVFLAVYTVLLAALVVAPLLVSGNSNARSQQKQANRRT